MDSNNLSDNNNNLNNNVDKDKLDNFLFPLDINDTILVLTINNSDYKKDVGNLVSKMIVIKELKYVSLDYLSKRLGFMGIEELNIFSIHNRSDIPPHSFVYSDKGCLVKYMESRSDIFIKFINQENRDFRNYNKHSLFIVRGGDYISIKNMFNTINNQEVNLGRGGSQKAHMLSPLDFRLSCYMMAMSGFNHNLINKLNTFNYITKDRYLSWTDKSSYLSNLRKSKNLKDDKEFKSIYPNKMAEYAEDEYLEEYNLKCKD